MGDDQIKAKLSCNSRDPVSTTAAYTAATSKTTTINPIPDKPDSTTIQNMNISTGITKMIMEKNNTSNKGVQPRNRHLNQNQGHGKKHVPVQQVNSWRRPTVNHNQHYTYQRQRNTEQNFKERLDNPATSSGTMVPFPKAYGEWEKRLAIPYDKGKNAIGAEDVNQLFYKIVEVENIKVLPETSETTATPKETENKWPNIEQRWAKVGSLLSSYWEPNESTTKSSTSVSETTTSISSATSSATSSTTSSTSTNTLGDESVSEQRKALYKANRETQHIHQATRVIKPKPNYSIPTKGKSQNPVTVKHAMSSVIEQLTKKVSLDQPPISLNKTTHIPTIQNDVGVSKEQESSEPVSRINGSRLYAQTDVHTVKSSHNNHESADTAIKRMNTIQANFMIPSVKLFTPQKLYSIETDQENATPKQDMRRTSTTKPTPLEPVGELKEETNWYNQTKMLTYLHAPLSDLTIYEPQGASRLMQTNSDVGAITKDTDGKLGRKRPFNFMASLNNNYIWSKYWIIR